ncbi:hypothetical protein DM82_1613 [Burkholderia oklahomensis]|uniref:Uncharacterized protein n=1 Tax=Burkholderia oklahomensis TaxID=342113 RepID=A0AAI8B5X2_9BURK|nr:hypothetical protein DM82_1613 [Burkholderia oklahomensis]
MPRRQFPRRPARSNPGRVTRALGRTQQLPRHRGNPQWYPKLSFGRNGNLFAPCDSRGAVQNGSRLENRRSPFTAPAPRRRSETREMPAALAATAGTKAKARIAPRRTANRLPPHADSRPAETSAKNRDTRSGSATVAAPAPIAAQRASVARRCGSTKSTPNAIGSIHGSACFCRLRPTGRNEPCGFRGTRPVDHAHRVHSSSVASATKRRLALAQRFACAIATRIALFRHPLSQQRIGDLDRLVAHRRRDVAHRYRVAIDRPAHVVSRSESTSIELTCTGDRLRMPRRAPHGGRVAGADVQAGLACAIARHRYARARRLRIGCLHAAKLRQTPAHGRPRHADNATCAASLIDANTRGRAVRRDCI